VAKRRASRPSWSRVDTGRKDRLRYLGIGRSEYEAGYTEKKLPPLTKARREEAVRAVGHDNASPEEWGTARRWYNSQYAPASVKNQPGLNKVAAAATIYSQIPNPGYVKEISFIPSSDPTWKALVTFKNGRSRAIEVPGYLVEDIRTWATKNDIDNDIGGTP
jgi:hypothetical protein